MKLKHWNELPRWAQVLLCITAPVWVLPLGALFFVGMFVCLFSVIMIEAYNDIVSLINRS
jgi:hypothetical protein